MLGSTTAPSRPGACDDAPVHVAFRSMHSVGVPGVLFSRLNPSLCAPLSTLRRHPRGGRRMTRGQCGSLDLHWERLALPTPCRSPGARIVNLSSGGMLLRSVARWLGAGKSFARL
jgi:hypothetical protein